MTGNIPSFRRYKNPAIFNLLNFINILFEFSAA